MNTSRGFASLIFILIVVGLVVLGGAGYYATNKNADSQSVDKEEASPTTSITQDKNTVSATAIPTVSELNIGILNLSLRGAMSESLMLEYVISGKDPGVNMFLSLRKKGTEVDIWGEEDARIGTSSIDLYKLMGRNDSPVGLETGDYYIILRDFHTGKELARSVPFRVTAGVAE